VSVHVCACKFAHVQLGDCACRMVGAKAHFQSDLQATDSFFLPESAAAAMCERESVSGLLKGG